MTTDTTERAGQLAEALAAAQAELPRIGKDNTAQVRSEKGQYSYSYADLADVSAAVLPVLARNGLAWTTLPTVLDGAFVLRYELLHTSGEALRGVYPLPNPGDPQKMGSAITYARRYTLCAVSGVAPDADDDDGQAAAQAHRDQQGAPRQQGQQGGQQRRQGPPDGGKPQTAPDDQDNARDRARRAEQMLGQVLAATTREQAVGLWRVTKNAAYAKVDVSGLLTDTDRAALGVDQGTEVTIQQVAAKVGAYVKDNGSAVRPKDTGSAGEAPPAGSEAEAEVDDHDAAQRYEDEAVADEAAAEQS